MYTDISIVKLATISREMRFYEAQLKNEYDQLEIIIKNLSKISSDAMDTVLRNLKRKREKLYEAVRKMQLLYLVLDKVIDSYRKCEEEIVDYEEQLPVKARAIFSDFIPLADLKDELSEIHILFK